MSHCDIKTKKNLSVQEMTKNHQEVSAELIEAYRQTHFRVLTEPATTLQIGQKNQQLIELMRVNRVTSSAFITACNPFSQALSDEENAQRMKSLLQELRNRSLTFLEGVGQHPSNQWPGESSYLVLGLSLEAAKTLGRNFEQHAIVWAGQDGIPQLVMLNA